jgi:hypothetical protein
VISDPGKPRAGLKNSRVYDVIKLDEDDGVMIIQGKSWK